MHWRECSVEDGVTLQQSISLNRIWKAVGYARDTKVEIDNMDIYSVRH